MFHQRIFSYFLQYTLASDSSGSSNYNNPMIIAFQPVSILDYGFGCEFT